MISEGLCSCERLCLCFDKTFFCLARNRGTLASGHPGEESREKGDLKRPSSGGRK